MKAFDILKSREVNRLCHFTKFQNLTHIISSEYGIRASNSIRQDIKNITDTARYDDELDYICCSVEYPNSWFLKKAMQHNSDSVFKDWVVLYIDLQTIKDKNTKFCPCNASKQRGKYINDNMDQIDSIFDHTVPTFQYPRTSNMLPCCPTDGQAEILIKDNIPRDYIIGIAVGDKDIAKRIYGMLKIYGLESISIYIAPDVLTSNWSKMIKNGQRPMETKCNWLNED